LFTTYIGSFPLSFSQENVRRVIDDVVNIGIDYPNYPQLRDFIEQFLEPHLMAGSLIKEEGQFRLRRVIDAKVDHSVSLTEARMTLEYARKKNYMEKVRGWRACVTGPFTLSSQIYVREGSGLEATAITDHEIVKTLAEYVGEVAKSMVRMGYTYICIDEPILGLIVGKRVIFYGYKVEEIVEILSTIFKRLEAKTRSIHVCGRVSPLLVETLASLPLEVLDHEFAGSPANLEIISREVLERYDKMLAFGCISTKRLKVEELNDVVRLILKAIERYGYERIFVVKPDCGFRGLRGLTTEEEAYKASIEKLRVLKRAASEVEARLGHRA